MPEQQAPWIAIIALLGTAVILLSACDSYDSDFFPYAVKGLRVFVYDNNTRREFFGGQIEASYFSRQKALSECASRAQATASFNNLREWSYVCCTVTSSSDCATKVR